ncbi:MAG: flagellin [Sulfitobacter sp.]|jgi:flagellin|uniref:flagellin N-terminal helical domain-containing protein n=1 Tax=unclassified Sulfitobacter TaxID=196795 RepID=UPI0007C304B8|nr:MULTISPECIES: flagellin [unclassified Sulfitobacter]KZX92325.1 flagellar protein [Sulfitobacter sp. HI0021]KZX96037.1 flagellar protein [Sulfitobacter sp. HI0027]KZZ02798.1 flagellar protein [Sulfitobacter sp. HI0076]
MSSINTNTSAMNALSTLRSVNSSLNQTQDRISTGLKVSSGKDNAAYFAISETMKGESGMNKSINEGLTLTKNSVATARVGAENFQELAQTFQERVAFAQGAKGGYAEIEQELGELVKQMTATVTQATFNGDDLVGAATVAAGNTASTIDTATGVVTPTDNRTVPGTNDTRTIVTGVARSGTGVTATTMSIDEVDLAGALSDFQAIASGFQANAEAATGDAFLRGALTSSEAGVKRITSDATTLGLAEASIEGQQEFLTKLSDNIDAGVGSMVDANMEEEAARLQALQVQQQLASQSLSIANQAPQNILSLFR